DYYCSVWDGSLSAALF
nr:immunoglobulin light chain junction region [Macaca mulatta]